MTPRAIRRRNRVNPELLRAIGITPATIERTGPEVALILAGLKLSFAATLKRHLNKSRKRDVISGFNCSRTDGSPIVKGCSIEVWRMNYERALSEALAYMEMVTQ